MRLDPRGTPREQVAWCLDQFEGGWANDPADRGGPTLMGMTLQGWRDYSGAWITSDELAAKSAEELLVAHVELAAKRSKFDFIADWRLRLVALDWAIISSRYTVCPHLQRAVGVTADGIFGPQTLAAVNAGDGLRSAARLNALRERFHIKDVRSHPEQRRFMLTWWDRVATLNDVITQPDGPPGDVRHA